MTIKPTTAQTVAFHTLESAGVSVLITVLVGIGQFLATSGLNLPLLGGTAGALFVGSMSMVYKSLATNPQVEAGIVDTVNEVRAAIQSDIGRLAQTLTSGAQPAAPMQFLQAPAQLDAASVADTILQHLDLSQVAQGLARELVQIRVPSPQAVAVPPRPNVAQQSAYAPQPPQPQPFRAG